MRVFGYLFVQFSSRVGSANEGIGAVASVLCGRITTMRDDLYEEYT